MNKKQIDLEKFQKFNDVHTELATSFMNLMNIIKERCPNGRGQALAITRLQESLHWVNHSLLIEAFENDEKVEVEK